MSEISVERNRIHELRKLLNEANHAYYVEDRPQMPDREYDERLSELALLEMRHPDLHDQSSPTCRVGGEIIEGFESRTHRIRMRSIDNTYDIEGLAAWHDRMLQLVEAQYIEMLVDIKIDGVAVNLVYINGDLDCAITRGDGDKGDDITAQVRAIRSIPLSLKDSSAPNFLEVRGEIYMKHETLDNLNKKRLDEGLALFQNPRNATSGTLKSLNTSVVASRNLFFAAHGRGFCQGWEDIGTHEDFLSRLVTSGVPVLNPLVVDSNFQEITLAIENFESKRAKSSFPIDGAVVRVNNFKEQEKVGVTSKAPRWCVAYKYPAERGQSKLLEVEWQVGKNGTLTPRATLEPVRLAGTTVRHASLHNIEEIRRRNLKIGSQVWVEKAGEIIPQVVGVLAGVDDSNAREIDEPKLCPRCKSGVERQGPKCYCVNPFCAAQFEEKLIWFVARGQMSIEGLGDRVARALVENGFVKTFADLWNLTKQQLATLELHGKSKRILGEKVAEKVIVELEKAKTRPFSTILGSVGIPQIGGATAKAVAARFPSYYLLKNATLEELQQISDVGEVTADILFNFLKSKEGDRLFRALEDVGVRLDISMEVFQDSILYGKKIVITGSFEGIDRKKFKSRLEELGAIVMSSISSRTDLLFSGEKGGSKVDKARSLSIEIWNESRVRQELPEFFS